MSLALALFIANASKNIRRTGGWSFVGVVLVIMPSNLFCHPLDFEFF